MDYPVASLTEEDEFKLRKLEQELGVILIAYDEREDNFTETTNAFVDDPNVNLI
jgi:hypothetical protein